MNLDWCATITRVTEPGPDWRQRKKTATRDLIRASALRVTVAACLAAATTAILAWVETDGTAGLPGLVGQAFDTLTRLQ